MPRACKRILGVHGMNRGQGASNNLPTHAIPVNALISIFQSGMNALLELFHCREGRGEGWYSSPMDSGLLGRSGCLEDESLLEGSVCYTLSEPGRRFGMRENLARKSPSLISRGRVLVDQIARWCFQALWSA